MAIEMYSKIVDSDESSRWKAQTWMGIAAQLFLLVFEREECFGYSVDCLLFAAPTSFTVRQ